MDTNTLLLTAFFATFKMTLNWHVLLIKLTVSSHSCLYEQFCVFLIL